MLPPPVTAWILHTPLASGVIDMVEYNLIMQQQQQKPAAGHHVYKLTT